MRREQHREERHEQHAATDTEQPREKSGCRSEAEQQGDEDRRHERRQRASFTIAAYSLAVTGVIESRLPR